MPRLRFTLPSALSHTATITTAGDWSVVQKAGESVLSKIPAGTFGPLLASSVYGVGDTNTGIAFPGSDVISFTEGGVECARFTAAGEFSCPNGALLKRPDQSSTLPVYAFANDADTGLGTHADNAIGLITNGALRFGINSGGMFPASNGSLALGTSSYRYKEIWCTQTDINTSSDARLKTGITDSDLGLEFIQALRPVRYKWLVGDRIPQADGSYVDRAGVRPHYGLIAQEVKQALDVVACDDFAGWVYDPESDSYALRMAEFIAPLIKAVQDLAARVEALEAQIGGSEA